MKSTDELHRLILRTAPDAEPHGAEITVSLNPQPDGMRLHIRRLNVTNHLLRDIITGLFLSLDDADRTDELYELVTYYRGPNAVAPWTARQIADKLRSGNVT